MNRFWNGVFKSASLASVMTLVAGCGEATVPVFPVTGSVNFKGKPPGGALIVLSSTTGGAEGFAPTATVKDDGSFAITSYQPGDGAPQGEYVATLQWFKVVNDAGGSGPGPNVLPKEYASAKSSPIKISVGSGPTQVPPIIIK
jgi:hypothetical protein